MPFKDHFRPARFLSHYWNHVDVRWMLRQRRNRVFICGLITTKVAWLNWLFPLEAFLFPSYSRKVIKFTLVKKSVKTKEEGSENKPSVRWCTLKCAFFNRQQSSWICFEPQRPKLHFITHNLNQFSLLLSLLHFI